MIREYGLNYFCLKTYWEFPSGHLFRMFCGSSEKKYLLTVIRLQSLKYIYYTCFLNYIISVMYILLLADLIFREMKEGNHILLSICFCKFFHRPSFLFLDIFLLQELGLHKCKRNWRSEGQQVAVGGSEGPPRTSPHETPVQKTVETFRHFRGAIMFSRWSGTEMELRENRSGWPIVVSASVGP